MRSTAARKATAPPNECPVTRSLEVGYFSLRCLAAERTSVDTSSYVSQNPRCTLQLLQSPKSCLKNLILLYQLMKSCVPKIHKCNLTSINNNNKVVLLIVSNICLSMMIRFIKGFHFNHVWMFFAKGSTIPICDWLINYSLYFKTTFGYLCIVKETLWLSMLIILLQSSEFLDSLFHICLYSHKQQTNCNNWIRHFI